MAIRMAERVLELIKHGGAFDQNFSGDPSEVWEAEGKGNRWTIRADRVEQALDRAETWTYGEIFWKQQQRLCPIWAWRSGVC